MEPRYLRELIILDKPNHFCKNFNQFVWKRIPKFWKWSFQVWSTRCLLTYLSYYNYYLFYKFKWFSHLTFLSRFFYFTFFFNYFLIHTLVHCSFHLWSSWCCIYLIVLKWTFIKLGSSIHIGLTSILNIIYWTLCFLLLPGTLILISCCKFLNNLK